MDGRFRNVTDLSQPEFQRVVEAASRKGVALDIRLMPGSTHTAEEAAAAVDAELGQIVKTLVLVAPRPEGRLVPIVCLVSGRNQADRDALAAVSGEVAIRAATPREALGLTGYSIGSMPAFGYGHDVRILMDRDLCQYEWVWAGAGTNAAIFRIAPLTLRMLANAVVAPVARASWMHVPAAAQADLQLQFEAGT
jgi:prolyl-tRNA editing enzyme YbaK/EbsC (Cys-tRNA(Pro) deacylase)